MTDLGEPVERQLSDDQTFRRVDAGPGTAQDRARRPARSAAGRGRGTADRQAAELHPADPLRVGRGADPAQLRRQAGRGARRAARPQQRARPLRRPRRLAAPVGHAGARVRGQRGPVARARRRGRRALQERARPAAPRRSPTNGPATRGRSRRTPRPRGARSTAASRSRSGTTSRARRCASRKCSSPRRSSASRSAAWRPSASCRYQEGHARRARVRNLVAAPALRGRQHVGAGRVHRAGPQGAREPRRQAERGRALHRPQRRRRR